ncbi:hypothetical protein Pfo_019511 [Paulownia fortunei]|nr:hypothetical protein Pfo_019511 [Paulownia fortunei]
MIKREIKLHFCWRLYSISSFYRRSCRCMRALVKVGAQSPQSVCRWNFSGHEDNVLHPSLLSNALNLVESDLTGAALYKSTNNPPMATNALPLNMPLQEPIFEGVRGQSHLGSFPDAEQLASSLDPTFVMGGHVGMIVLLLNSLNNALQSSGVDLSQASISVQLDVGKRTNGGSINTMFYIKDHENASGLDYGAPMDIGENYEHPLKRFRADQT